MLHGGPQDKPSRDEDPYSLRSAGVDRGSRDCRGDCPGPLRQGGSGSRGAPSLRADERARGEGRAPPQTQAEVSREASLAPTSRPSRDIRLFVERLAAELGETVEAAGDRYARRLRGQVITVGDPLQLLSFLATAQWRDDRDEVRARVGWTS